MRFRIALFGASELMKSRLTDLLRAAEYAVDQYDPSAISSIFDCRLHAYDIVIAHADLTSGLEEDVMFRTLLASRGFLIFDEKIRTQEEDPLFLIHAGMSSEDIVSKINNVLYLNSSVRKSPRLRVNLPVEYEHSGTRCRSTMQDLSENGAFIITISPPPDRSLITLRFMLPGRSGDISVAGRTAYSIACNLDQSIISHPSSRERKIIAIPGFGMSFDRMEDADRDAVREFLNSKL